MPADLSRVLVIGISSRALFDLTESNEVYERDGLLAYAKYQFDHADDVLAPGTGYSLTKAILALNEKASGQQKAQVVVVSRNNTATSLRIFNSIKHYGLPIERAVLSGGTAPAKYLDAFCVDLFLSCSEEDVREALVAKFPAALIYHAPECMPDPADQIRIAFDGDAVVFSDESERVYQESGLDAFIAHEVKKAREQLPDGPFAKLLRTLHKLQNDPAFQKPPIRTALVTARSMPTHERVLRTLQAWGIQLDEAFFMGGVPKTKVLAAFRPHIFFDDQQTHCDPASRVVPTGQVPCLEAFVTNVGRIGEAATPEIIVDTDHCKEPMEPAMMQSDLKPADILLYRSNTWLAKAIRLLDGTEVSHAGVYLGDGVVGEALVKEGLGCKPIDNSIAGCDWVAVRRLNGLPDTMRPVLDTAKTYLNQGNRYAYGQILLLAMVCSTRKLDLSNPLLRRIVYSAINNAAAFVRRMQSAGKQPMICSEFVYRSYDEALPQKVDPFTVEIEPLWSAAGRARLLGRRRREQQAATVGHIHPESLLGQLQAEAGGLHAAIGTPSKALAAPPPEVGEAELDAMIDAYLSQQSGTLSKTAAVAAAGPEVTEPDLRDAVGGFAHALHDATDAGRKLGRGAFAAPVARACATPADTLLEISADFVTPGDLFKSSSLNTIGELRP